MDAIQERIETFNRIKPDANGEFHGKTTIIEALEDEIADERVLSFFMKVVADHNEFDLARLEVLKIIRLWDAPSEEIKCQIGRLLADIMASSSDVLIQQWTAIAAENFAEVPEVFITAATLLTDPSVDLDVRHNCLSIFKSLGKSEQASDVLRLVADDVQIGNYARQILSEWGLDTAV